MSTTHWQNKSISSSSKGGKLGFKQIQMINQCRAELFYCNNDHEMINLSRESTDDYPFFDGFVLFRTVFRQVAIKNNIDDRNQLDMEKLIWEGATREEKARFERLAEEIKSKRASLTDDMMDEHMMEDYDIISIENVDPSFQDTASNGGVGILQYILRIIFWLIDARKNSQQSFDRTPVVTTKSKEFANQAEQFGFIRDKFFHWLSSISEELLPTQTLEYWILSYVSETATATTSVWDEVITPDVWLSKCFPISLGTARAIVSGVSSEYLKKQTPKYWIEDWIIQQTNQTSPEFLAFIENAASNRLILYDNKPFLVVDKTPVSGEDDELRCLLSQLELSELSNDCKLYYHTTRWVYAEDIIFNGIDVGKCHNRQDFGKSGSYYLNDEFRWATEFARHRFQDSWAIIVYDIPLNLLEQKHDHLDLSQEPEMWKNIVRHSRNGLNSEADDYDSVFGPQSENGGRLIADRNVTPIQSANKNQLALKTRKLTKKVDLLLKGVIIYRNDFVMVEN